MEIARRISDAFHVDVRREGERLFLNGKVDVIDLGPTFLQAVVRDDCADGREYDATIELDGQGSWSASCGCPDYQTSGPCEHLWAVLRQASEYKLVALPGRVVGELMAAGTPHGVRPATVANEASDLGHDARAAIQPAPLPAPAATTQSSTVRESDPIAEEAVLRVSSQTSLPAAAHRAMTTEAEVIEEPVAADSGAWRSRFSAVQGEVCEEEDNAWARMGARDFRIEYMIDLAAARDADDLVLLLTMRKRLQGGAWGKRKAFDPAARSGHPAVDPFDREIMEALRGSRGPAGDSHAWAGTAYPACYYLGRVLAEQLLPRLCESGRCLWRRDSADEGRALSFDAAGIWTFGLRLHREERNGTVALDGYVTRGEFRYDLTDPTLFIVHDFVIHADELAPFDARGAQHWVRSLLEGGTIRAPLADEGELVHCLIEIPGDPGLELPDKSVLEGIDPTPHLVVSTSEEDPGRARFFDCRIWFDYDGVLIAMSERASVLEKRGGRLILRRNRPAERRALRRFLDAGGRSDEAEVYTRDAIVAAKRLGQILPELIDEGWTVVVDGHEWKRALDWEFEVESDVEWFDLRGGLDFGGALATFPAILQALEEGRRTVVLSDGSIGVLPADLNVDWRLIERMGKPEGDSMRFHKSQGWILDALLQVQAEVKADEGFRELQRRLEGFKGIRPIKEPSSFQGTLREYQRESLSWFAFLREMGFGGCLADDMGLGKTVQILALLEMRRVSAEEYPPSMVVAPSSLVYNWVQEAGRFAPELKAIAYVGTNRKALLPLLSEYDLVVTTYGTMRRDVLELSAQRFDYLILDEAQAIKNSSSQITKAAWLLEAAHRLALSGTPIENHLGELCSLFEFMNPGLLGRSSEFNRMMSAKGPKALDDGDRAFLSRSLRPFFLRRTKEQVLSDLPRKTEQVLECEMSGAQKSDYTALREYYRQALLKRADVEGMGGMKMHVLEALLRLRQCSCHPGLIDEQRREEGSSKLDVLMPMLREIVSEGHKALVFSQFTGFLGILRDRLDAEGLSYEYLDGATRDRQDMVNRFQSDEGSPLFLISLKAGGFGLTLTAADYVFLLDPWWNPAVEAQAIDRIHRYGQTRPVHAYRLISRGTVEERVMELQRSKRELAEAILGEGNASLKSMTRDDLEELLS